MKNRIQRKILSQDYRDAPRGVNGCKQRVGSEIKLAARAGESVRAASDIDRYRGRRKFPGQLNCVSRLHTADAYHRDSEVIDSNHQPREFSREAHPSGRVPEVHRQPRQSEDCAVYLCFDKVRLSIKSFGCSGSEAEATATRGPPQSLTADRENPSTRPR